MLSEPRCPPVKLVLGLALEPVLARAQSLELRVQVQALALVQVAELAQLEPLAQV